MNELELFISRKIKAKEIFKIIEISKSEAYNFIKSYHYLKDAKFFSKFQFGCYYKNTLLGVATFSNPQGNVTLKGWFGVDNKNQTILELSRLCVHPSLNGTNLTSFLLGNSLKFLKKKGIQAVITLADSSRHVGSIYQVCNFKYYGLTDAKSDFYSVDGKINPRGKTKNKQGVWLPRTRKHRYAYIMDNSLKCLYDEKPKPKKNEIIKFNVCRGCQDSKIVIDKRFNVKYTCPLCGEKLLNIVGEIKNE